MRVTENINYDTIRNSIRTSKERLENLQSQSATLKKLNQPSDDPVAASKVLELRTDKVNNDQFQMNAKMAETFLENTDHALGDLSNIIMRAKEIALNQASVASSSEETRMGVAEEVSELFKQAVATANRKVGERFLFGGFKTLKPPVDSEGKYGGDDGRMTVEVANDVFLTMNVPGVEAFNTHPLLSQEGKNDYLDLPKQTHDETDELETNAPLENVNVFEELQNFRIALVTGDIEGIQNTLDRFDQIFNRLVMTRAKVGSRIQGLHSAGQAMERHNITNAMLSSSLEDADMVQVVNDMNKEETVFKSSLASAKRLVQPTLLDFLR